MPLYLPVSETNVDEAIVHMGQTDEISSQESTYQLFTVLHEREDEMALHI